MLSPASGIWAAVKTLIFSTGLRFVGTDLVLDNRLVRDIFVSKYLCTRSFWSSFLVSQLIKLISLDQVFRYLENDFNRAPDFNSKVPSGARNLGPGCQCVLITTSSPWCGCWAVPPLPLCGHKNDQLNPAISISPSQPGPAPPSRVLALHERSWII